LIRALSGERAGRRHCGARCWQVSGAKWSEGCESDWWVLRGRARQQCSTP
jgi:hypothetical protein